MLKVTRSLLATLLLGVTLSSCGVDQPVGLPGTPGVPAALQGEWNQIQLAPWNTRYQGERLVTVTVELDGSERVQTRYTELVSSDGSGRFNILPLQAETPVAPDEPTFLTLQAQREGFYYRYRDFRIRDLEAFRENYRHLDTGTSVTVAGRSAWEVRFVRNGKKGRVYAVAFDLETGLVLRSNEYGPRGLLLSGLEFTSLDLDPDLSGVAFFVPGNDEQGFDLESGEGEGILGFKPHLPKSVPAGFVLYETASVTDDMGYRWFKAGFTDGVEMVFFLHRERGAGTFDLPMTATAKLATPRDEVRLFRAGRVSAAQGTVRGQDLIVIGEASERELLQMLRMEE